MANLNYYANFIKIPINHPEFLATHKVTHIMISAFFFTTQNYAVLFTF